MFSTVTMYDVTVFQRVLTCSIDPAMMPLLPHIQSGAHRPGFRVIQSLSSVFSPLVLLFLLREDLGEDAYRMYILPVSHGR